MTDNVNESTSDLFGGFDPQWAPGENGIDAEKLSDMMTDMFARFSEMVETVSAEHGISPENNPFATGGLDSFEMFGFDPNAPAPEPYVVPESIPRGEGTTDPFAILYIDGPDWVYNTLYISTDASVLDRLLNDKVTQFDELVSEVLYSGGAGGDEELPGVPLAGNSQGEWWKNANEAMDAANIPEDRRFEAQAY